MKLLNIKKALAIVLILIFVGCAAKAPYKIMPYYEEVEGRIETIALYPLFYSDDGEEERRFGEVFSDIFFESVLFIPTIEPLLFIEPDSIVLLFKEKGIPVVKHSEEIVEDTILPVYNLLTTKDINAISEEADALIFCDLITYNEVSAGGELGQMLATGCLTFGTVVVSEANVVSMEITLFESTTGEPIWKYTPGFKSSLSGEQRTNFSKSILEGFKKYFPLSRDFESE